MKSIKTGIVSFVGVILILTLSIITVINYNNTQKMIMNDLNQTMTSTTLNAAKDLGAWIGLRKGELETIANAPVMAAGDETAIKNYLGTELKRLPDFSTFWLPMKKEIGTHLQGLQEVSVKEIIIKNS